MVYGGKPSKGCRTCRARRIKCDEGKPTCQRCAKSKRECGGYRPEFDFVHRDQTSFTLRRANEVEEVAKTASSSSSSSPPSSSSSSPPSSSSSSSPPSSSSSSPPSSSSSATVTSPPLWPSPTNILTIPLAQRATCHFASNFILIPLDTAPHGFLDYLVPLIRSEPQGSSLRYALNACAFALLSNRAKADAVNLSKLSLKEHTLALAETYRALANPKTATSDATLAAVLLLSLYETITARKETRMLAWRSHIDGAVNIVQTRGSEMCRTKIGALLFAAVRQQLISRTLSSGIPLPLGTDWWLQDGYSNTLLSTAQRFALECADIKTELSHILATCPKSPESFQLVRKESQRIQDLDHSIANWLVSIPQDFRFTTICWVWEDDLGLSKGGSYAEVDVFPGRVDVYPDYVTASAWNLAHVTRLILASCDIRATAWICAPADYKDTSEYATSRRICEGTISEVLASVPYHFGWHLNRGKGGLLSDISGFACGDEAGQLKALPAFFLLWSITCVKNIDIATPEQRAWAKGRLKAISEQIGLRYAQVVNDAEFRFPSMLILQDAMAARSTDPFYRSVQAAPVPSRVEPLTPESMSSVKGSPSP